MRCRGWQPGKSSSTASSAVDRTTTIALIWAEEGWRRHLVVRQYVAVADDGDGGGVSDATDELPVGRLAVPVARPSASARQPAPLPAYTPRTARAPAMTWHAEARATPRRTTRSTNSCLALHARSQPCAAIISHHSSRESPSSLGFKAHLNNKLPAYNQPTKPFSVAPLGGQLLFVGRRRFR